MGSLGVDADPSFVLHLIDPIAGERSHVVPLSTEQRKRLAVETDLGVDLGGAGEDAQHLVAFLAIHSVLLDVADLELLQLRTADSDPDLIKPAEPVLD